MATSTNASRICLAFHGLIEPPLHVDSFGKVHIPEDFRVILHGGINIYDILSSTTEFLSYDEEFCNALIQTLCLCQRDVYDVVRFRMV